MGPCYLALTGLSAVFAPKLLLGLLLMVNDRVPPRMMSS